MKCTLKQDNDELFLKGKLFSCDRMMQERTALLYPFARRKDGADSRRAIKTAHWALELIMAPLAIDVSNRDNLLQVH
jgi:hypothetical protein